MDDKREQNFIMEWGAVVRLARRASLLASEEMRKNGTITDPLDGAIMLYTDDPTTATWFAACDDMAVICKTSKIEDVAIVMGEKFPPASHEAERDDPELQRVAAMWFPAPGEKCPRCRNFTKNPFEPHCAKCDGQILKLNERSNNAL